MTQISLCRTKQKQNQKSDATHNDNQKKKNKNIRKYVLVKILDTKVKLQLDSGSDLLIINVQTLKRLNKPTMQEPKKKSQNCDWIKNQI